MRMLLPSLGHQSPEDCEFGEWEGSGWGAGIQLPLHQIVFCAGKRSRGRETPTRTSAFRGERPAGSGPWRCSREGLEGLGRQLTGGGQEGEPRLRGLVSVVLDFAYPKRLFFPSFAKYFSEMENNLSV